MTFEFHEPTRGACVVAGDAKTGNAIWIIGMRRRINVIIAVIRENRATSRTLYSPRANIRDPRWIVTFNIETGRDPRPI